MTPAATEFISPLTLSTLSGQPVFTRFSDEDSGQWNNHVALGAWADLMLKGPASADTIAKFASGLFDNLLSAVYFSATCPVYTPSAMYPAILRHASLTPDRTSSVSRQHMSPRFSLGARP